MKLVYVFKPRDAFGVAVPFRVPTTVARAICCIRPSLDYAESERGTWRDHYPLIGIGTDSPWWAAS